MQERMPSARFGYAHSFDARGFGSRPGMFPVGYASRGGVNIVFPRASDPLRIRRSG